MIFVSNIRMKFERHELLESIHWYEAMVHAGYEVDKSQGVATEKVNVYGYIFGSFGIAILNFVRNAVDSEEGLINIGRTDEDHFFFLDHINFKRHANLTIDTLANLIVHIKKLLHPQSQSWAL